MTGLAESLALAVAVLPRHSGQNDERGHWRVRNVTYG